MGRVRDCYRQRTRT